MSRHSSGRKVGPFCDTIGRIDRQVGPLSSETGSRFHSSQFLPYRLFRYIWVIFLPIIARRDRTTSQEMGSEKCTESGNSWFLFPTIPSAKKDRKVMPSNRSFFTKLVYKYKQTAFQVGDSQVSKTIVNGQWMGCLRRSDGCISSCSDTSEIQKIPSVSLQTSGISVHGQNVPMSMDFRQINECNSSTLKTTCSISLYPYLVDLANKRSDSQSTYLTQNTLFKRYKIWVSYQI